MGTFLSICSVIGWERDVRVAGGNLGWQWLAGIATQLAEVIGRAWLVMSRVKIKSTGGLYLYLVSIADLSSIK